MPEIPNEITKIETTKILDKKIEIKEIPKYELKNTDKKLEIHVELQNIESMKEIELLVNEKCVKIQAKNYEEISINLQGKIDLNTVKANFSKSKKVLKIILNKLN